MDIFALGRRYLYAFFDFKLLEVTRFTKNHVATAEACEHQEGNFDAAVLTRLFEAMITKLALLEMTSLSSMQTLSVELIHLL